MKMFTVVFCCTALAFILLACTQSAPTNSAAPTAKASPTVSPTQSVPSDEFAAIRPVYAKDCEGCHGDKGEGGLVKVEDKHLKVPSFKSDHSVKHSDDDFIKQITKGGEGMPSFKDKLTADQMQTLVKFIRKEFQGK